MTVTFNEIISNSESSEEFLNLFHEVLDTKVDEPHRVILLACYKNPGLSPKLKDKTKQRLVRKWLNKYQKGFQNRISQRISRPPQTKPDPIINTIISSRLTELTEEHLEQISYAHRLSMSAENIQGLLLEEFLAEELAHYGWFCGWGETIRFVDFCNLDGSLLQVKNRSNSENSSSSRVRSDRPIEKWYRIEAKTGQYKWSYFNDRYQTDRFSEENFISFVKRVLAKNLNALPVEPNNPWQSV
ncbi:SinI family restriction endonuclease [Oscillatoriales cyanobacterium LEGE 11467]|uniref:SinI family restriction endonuclease n=1 Tax=Zarconia navalis LEGE 11467 TaxID=1828826 RepID=A0A928VV25_9CYAN|nr:SinI family restriction endonuclease [Zarconia navalis]MBE9040034.1 SinI family restriction endonuclease [Zarconia navalis LEGE 11467]